jgi:hypothetical protein
MILPLEAKTWLLNVKTSKQEDDKMKKSLALSKSIAVSNDKETSNSHMPYCVKLDSICHKLRVTQKMVIQDVGNSICIIVRTCRLYDPFLKTITNYGRIQFTQAKFLDTRQYSMESVIIF